MFRGNALYLPLNLPLNCLVHHRLEKQQQQQQRTHSSFYFSSDFAQLKKEKKNVLIEFISLGGHYSVGWEHAQNLHQFTLHQIWNYTRKIHSVLFFPSARQQWQSAFDSIALEHMGKIIPRSTSNSSVNYYNADSPASVVMLLFFFFRFPLQESISGGAETLIMFSGSGLTQSIIFQLNLLVSPRMNHWKCILII